MTSENTSDNLNLGRGWLNRAAEMLDSCEDHVSDAEFARAAAAIGNGFIALAHAERAARTAGALDAAAERVRRAADEARPHDDMSLHTALALGIERGLRDVGADLSGCTPSMLTGHVIRQLRDTGPWEIAPATTDGEANRG